MPGCEGMLTRMASATPSAGPGRTLTPRFGQFVGVGGEHEDEVAWEGTVWYPALSNSATVVPGGEGLLAGAGAVLMVGITRTNTNGAVPIVVR
jgi:hypothetical protein